MTKTFRDAFIEARKRQGWSVERVAELAKVSKEQLKKLDQGKTQKTNVDDAVKVAHAFGMTVEEFIDDHFPEEREETVRLWLQLSDQERSLLQAASRGLRDEGREAG